MLWAMENLEQKFDRPLLMTFELQCYFASQSNTCFSSFHPALQNPPQSSWQGGQFWCSLVEEAILKGDMGSCQPHSFSISGVFLVFFLQYSISEYLVYLVCFQ